YCLLWTMSTYALKYSHTHTHTHIPPTHTHTHTSHSDTLSLSLSLTSDINPSQIHRRRKGQVCYGDTPGMLYIYVNAFFLGCIAFFTLAGGLPDRKSVV